MKKDLLIIDGVTKRFGGLLANQPMPAGNRVICPTEKERAFCEAGISIMGVSVPGQPITHGCTGAPAECAMDGGVCADPMAANGLPPHLRRRQDLQPSLHHRQQLQSRILPSNNPQALWPASVSEQLSYLQVPSPDCSTLFLLPF